MKFNALMHVSFYTAKYDEMIDFYVNKLGLKQHVLVKWKEYKGRTDRPQMAARAEADPEEAEREARTVKENSGLTDAEFRPADEGKKDE